jgi:hypothetical protein
LDAGEAAGSEDGRGLVRALRDDRVRTEGAQLAQNPDRQRGVEEGACEQQRLGDEPEVGTAVGTRRKDAEVELLADRVPFPPLAVGKRRPDSP